MSAISNSFEQATSPKIATLYYWYYLPWIVQIMHPDRPAPCVDVCHGQTCQAQRTHCHESRRYQHPPIDDAASRPRIAAFRRQPSTAENGSFRKAIFCRKSSPTVSRSRVIRRCGSTTAARTEKQSSASSGGTSTTSAIKTPCTCSRSSAPGRKSPAASGANPSTPHRITRADPGRNHDLRQHGLAVCPRHRYGPSAPTVRDDRPFDTLRDTHSQSRAHRHGRPHQKHGRDELLGA